MSKTHDLVGKLNEYRPNADDLMSVSLNEHKLEKLIEDTIGNWIVRATDTKLKRKVVLKISKPNQSLENQKRFVKEGEKLAKLKHGNIITVHAAGGAEIVVEGDSYRLNYMVVEHVDGEDLDHILKSRKITFKENLGIMDDVLNAVTYAHSKDVKHGDIKPKNIMREIGGSGGYFLIDFGGRTTIKDDVVGIGEVARTLLDQGEKYNKRTHRKLDKIVDTAKNGGFETPGDFKRAFRSYKGGISRRKWFKWLVPTVAALGLLGYGLFEYNNHINEENKRIAEEFRIQKEHDRYLRSTNYIIDEIGKVDASSYGKIGSLFGELEFRILDQKIRGLPEKENLRKVENGVEKFRFPYDISIGNKKWSNTDGTYWSSGFWQRILRRAFVRTEDEIFKGYAMEWIDSMKFSEKDDYTINLIRFYHSHALGYDDTGDEKLKDTALRATDLFVRNRFNPNGNFIQMTRGELKDGKTQRSYVDTMTAGLPLLCWAYRETKSDNLLEKIIAHSDVVNKFNINEDGSTIQVAEFNVNNMQKIRGLKSHGFSGESCLSRGQARAIKGFAEAYKTTKETRFLETAEKCAQYFIDNLPNDRVPFYDFKDPNKNIPKDSSAAAMGASGLLDLFEITSEEKYKLVAYEILKSLTTNYLSRDEDYQGLLLHGCSNANKGAATDVSLIYGDNYFLDALGRIQTYKINLLRKDQVHEVKLRN